MTFILKIALFVSQVILGHNFWTISDRNFMCGMHIQSIKTFSNDTKVNAIWPLNVTFILNIAVCKTQMPPLPQHKKSRLDLWPTDLNINRDHLLIKDYLTTKFEASGAKCSRVIPCTRFERLTWPLTLDLVTWLIIGIMYSSRTIYLPSLKLLGQSVVELSVAQGLKDWHDPWPLTYLPDYQ